MSDFLIIGAGINGMLVARELLAAGATVTLVDRGEPGREASWAGGGIVSPLYPWRYPAPITALASWAQAFYPDLAAQLESETGIDVGLINSGLLMLDAEDEEQALNWGQRNKRSMERLSCSRIYAQEPALAADFQSGLYMPEVAQVRNPRLCRALLQSLQQHPGFTLKSSLEAQAFATQGARIKTVRFRDHSNTEVSLTAGTVVVTAGAWSQLLLKPYAPQITVEPVKGQMLLFKLSQPPVRSIVLTAGRYLIPRADGYLLAGSTLEHAQFDKSATPRARQSLLTSARRLLPILEQEQPVAQWAGLRPGSGDGLPFIGRLPQWENLTVNAGQFRNGLVLAPASARLLVDLLLERQPVVDPRPYAPGVQRRTFLETG